MKYFLFLILTIELFLSQFFIQNIEYLKVITLVIYLLVFICTLGITKNLFHPNVLFLVSFFVFLLGRVVASFFNGINFARTEFFTTYTFSTHIQRSILFTLQLALLGFFIGSFPSYKQSSMQIIRKIRFSLTNEILQKIVFFFFVVSICAKIYVVVVYANQVFTKGYLSLYVSIPKIPKYVDLLLDMYFLSAAAVFTLYPNNRYILFFCYSYLIVLFLSILTGSRGTFVIELLTYIYFQTRGKEKKLSKLKVVFFSIIVICILQAAGSYRVGINKIDFRKLIVFFIWDQGGSVDIQGYTLQYLSKIPHNILLLIKPAIDPYITLLGLNTTLDLNNPATVMKTYSFGHILSYLVDKGKFQKGYGLGSSYLSELYVVGGYALVFIGSCTYSKFFSVLSKRAISDPLASFLLFVMMPFYIFSPRWSYLGFISNINYLVKYLPFVLLLYILLKYSNPMRLAFNEKSTVCNK